MKQSLNQKRIIQAIDKGVQNEVVQEDGTFSAKSNFKVPASLMRQLFVVEWQMIKVESKILNENAVRKGVWST